MNKKLITDGCERPMDTCFVRNEERYKYFSGFLLVFAMVLIRYEEVLV